MELKQKTYLEVEKGGKVVQLVVDQDMPLGLLFDALMAYKGYVVDRMTKAHKEEEEAAEKNMPVEEPQEQVEEPKD